MKPRSFANPETLYGPSLLFQLATAATPTVLEAIWCARHDTHTHRSSKTENRARRAYQQRQRELNGGVA